MHRDLPFRILVGLLAAILLYSMFLTERFWVLADRPVVAHMSNILMPPDAEDMIGAIDSYGVHVPYQPNKVVTAINNLRRVHGVAPPPPSFGEMSKPMLGYSIREICFFGMPFGWYREYGDVIYVTSDWGLLYAEPQPVLIKAINAANGRDVTQGNIFPFWAHAWGWLWVAGLGLALWLYHRQVVRKRAEEGLI